MENYFSFILSIISHLNYEQAIFLPNCTTHILKWKSVIQIWRKAWLLAIITYLLVERICFTCFDSIPLFLIRWGRKRWVIRPGDLTKILYWASILSRSKSLVLSLPAVPALFTCIKHFEMSFIIYMTSSTWLYLHDFIYTWLHL